ARCLALPKGALDFLRDSAPGVDQALQRRADELCAFAAVLRERPIGSLADGLLLELRRRSEVRRLEEGTVIVRASEGVRALVVVARKGPTVTLLGEHAHLRNALETWGADDPFQEW